MTHLTGTSDSNGNLGVGLDPMYPFIWNYEFLITLNSIIVGKSVFIGTSLNIPDTESLALVSSTLGLKSEKDNLIHVIYLLYYLHKRPIDRYACPDQSRKK